jgi:tetratricopeptide (TPR) repeat protein
MSDDNLTGYSEEEQKRRRNAIEWFKKASEALAKGNFDYAVEMFTNCVRFVPDHLNYRQFLRGAECKKYRNNRSGASLAFLRVAGVRTKTAKARYQKNWRELDHAAEEGLAINPWDAQFNADVGDAATHLGYNEVAIFSYEKAVETDSKNKEFLRSLARAYERKIRYPEAIRIWERVRELDPLDTEARTKITGLNATNTIESAGFDKAPALKDVVVKQGYEESIKGDVEQDGPAAPGESAEADLLHAIRKEPTAVGNYLKLADLYRRELRFDDAIAIYQRALEVTGGDINIRERLEDVQLEMGRRNRDFLKQDADQHPQDAALQQRLVDVKKELLQQEITVLSSRVERYPQDLRLKAELAQRFFQAGKSALAIPLYQQAAKDPRLEAVVLVSLGKCFLKERKNDLAEFQFKKAVLKLNASDHKLVLLDCHYWLGRLAEDALRSEDAISHYNEVIALDYNYKDGDARKRLEKLQGDRGDEGGLMDEV